MPPLPLQNSKIDELTDARRAGSTLVLVAFLFSIFVNLLMLSGPLFMLQVYDRVLGSRSEETLAALFLLVGALYLLMAALDYARGRVMARYGAGFQSALDATVFEANHNYGQTVSVWDWVFGTRYLPKDREPPEEIGIADLPTFPMTWWAQILSPFRWRRIKQTSEALDGNEGNALHGTR